MEATFHAGNRQLLYSRMKPSSMLLMFSGDPVRKTNDEYYPFFAERNFVYLTGLGCKQAAVGLGTSHRSFQQADRRLFIFLNCLRLVKFLFCKHCLTGFLIGNLLNVLSGRCASHCCSLNSFFHCEPLCIIRRKSFCPRRNSGLNTFYTESGLSLSLVLKTCSR